MASVVKNALKAIKEKGLGTFFRELKEEGYTYVSHSHLNFLLQVFLFINVRRKISRSASCLKLPFCFLIPIKLFICFQIHHFLLCVQDLCLAHL